MVKRHLLYRGIKKANRWKLKRGHNIEDTNLLCDTTLAKHYKYQLG